MILGGFYKEAEYNFKMMTVFPCMGIELIRDDRRGVEKKVPRHLKCQLCAGNSIHFRHTNGCSWGSVEVPEGTRTPNLIYIYIYIYMIVDDQSNIHGITLFHNVSSSWWFIPSKSINWLYIFMYMPLNCLIRIRHCYMLLRDNLAKPLTASGAGTSNWWPDCKVKDSENTWGLYY